MLEGELHALIGDIYASVLEPNLIPAVLSRAVRLTGSHRGAFAFWRRGALVHDIIDEIDPTVLPTHRHYLPHNLWFNRRLGFGAGKAVSGEEVVRKEEWARNPFYNEVLQPVGTVHGLFLPAVNTPELTIEISVYRGENREPHDARERQIADIIANHFSRAFRLAVPIEKARENAGTMAGALDRMAFGCMLVDSDGRLAHANAAAENLLSRDTPLRVLNGRIVAADPTNQRRWRRLLHGLSGRDTVPSGDAVRLRGNDGLDVQAVAIPLRHVPARVFGQSLPASPEPTLVVLKACHPSFAAAARLAAQIYRLTPAESDLLTALAGGHTLAAHAEARGRTLNTVKTHLSAIFAKTGTARQADLIRLVAALSPLQPDARGGADG